jgi:transcriptional regulator of arginine metabolism
MTKKERLSVITSLITREEISTQEELTARLIDLGYNVSQSTVSRDINELNLIKGEGSSKKFKYIKADLGSSKVSPQMLGLLRQILTSVACANNLVVIKTLAGHANSAGMAIDEMCFPEVLGTVAGDDTLLVVAKTNADAEIIVKTLKTL